MNDLITLGKVLLSNRQYAALKIFTDDPSRPVTMEMAIHMDQRSLGSLYHRGYIKYGREGFSLTRTGSEAKERFDHTIIIRDNPSRAFSHYMGNVRTLADYRTHTTRNGTGK